MSEPPVIWGEPYTQMELDAAQAEFGLTFPPDMIALLRTHRLAQGYDWVRDKAEIRRMLEWPLEGLLFDVENDGLWWPEWGPRPEKSKSRKTIVAEVVAKAPRLIPLFGHRFIPETPNESGNPVFSVYQSDVVVYGRDLEDYVRNEFISGPGRMSAGPVKTIPFWSEMVARERNSTR